MAGSSSAPVEEGKKKARIEIIPLIDVIFFLLATFVLFTLSLNKLASLPIDLCRPPRRLIRTSPRMRRRFFLNISETGTCYWKQGALGTPELISTAEIAPRLNDYSGRYGSQARVFLQGDMRAHFGPRSPGARRGPQSRNRRSLHPNHGATLRAIISAPPPMRRDLIVGVFISAPPSRVGVLGRQVDAQVQAEAHRGRRETEDRAHEVAAARAG